MGTEIPKYTGSFEDLLKDFNALKAENAQIRKMNENQTKMLRHAGEQDAEGMSLRDHIAIEVMKCILGEKDTFRCDHESVAMWIYAQTDAMLVESRNL